MPSVGRMVVWLVVIAIYVSVLIATFGIALIIFIIAMPLAYWAFIVDKAREKRGTDDFQDDNLFFRYGQRINQSNFSIPVDTKWSDAEVQSFASTMRQEILSKVEDRLGIADVVDVRSIDVQDRKVKSDSKAFLKISFKTSRGSRLTHFVHYAVVGKSIVAHYFTYMRGTYRWDDATNFILISPLSIWFWGLPWLGNRHSILTSMSKYISNSFDIMDLSTFYESSYYVLLDETRNYLKENDLLSEELAQVIFNNINNNNSQNINVNNSTGLNLGNITNLVPGAAKRNTANVAG